MCILSFPLLPLTTVYSRRFLCLSSKLAPSHICNVTTNSITHIWCYYGTSSLWRRQVSATLHSSALLNLLKDGVATDVFSFLCTLYSTRHFFVLITVFCVSNCALIGCPTFQMVMSQSWVHCSFMSYCVGYEWVQVWGFTHWFYEMLLYCTNCSWTDSWTVFAPDSLVVEWVLCLLFLHHPQVTMWLDKALYLSPLPQPVTNSPHLR